MTKRRSWNGVSPDDRIVARRSQLLEAAYEVMDERGIGGTSVRAICRTAGLTSRYFYESFVDVEALIATAIDDVMDELFSAASDALRSAPPDDFAARMRAVVETTSAIVERDPCRARVLMSLAASIDDVRQRRADGAHSFADLLREEATMAGLVWAPATSVFIAGGLTEVLLAWIDGDLDLTVPTLVDAVTDLIVHQARPGLR